MDSLRFDALVERHADGLASPDELNELAALLKAHPELRREFVERTRMEVALHSLLNTQAVANRPSVRVQVVRHTRARRRTRPQTSWLAPLAFAACVFLGFGVFFWQSQMPPKSPKYLASVEMAVQAEALREQGLEQLQPEHPVNSGETVSTPAGGSLSLRYPDGTRLTLGSSSRATLTSEGTGQHVLLLAGEVTATVARQPSGQAMVFETTTASATVLGTQLRFVNSGNATRLEVTEGRVRLLRISDGKSVEVGAGQTATAEAGKELIAESLIPRPRPRLIPLGTPLLAENFENGQMEGWLNGTVIAGGPDNSRHTLETLVNEDRAAAAFSSVRLPLGRLPSGTRDDQWLFTYHPGLVLQFDYWLDKNAGSLRIQGFNNEQDDNFHAIIEDPVAGQWATAQLRLETFKHNDPPRQAEALRPGTHFRSLQFHTGSPGVRIRIDNLVLAPASDKTR